jgi:hypothetical protein
MASRWIVGSSAFAALLLAGFAAAPAGYADCLPDPSSADCSNNDDAGYNAAPPQSVQAVLPFDGGPPEFGIPLGPDPGPYLTFGEDGFGYGLGLG